MGARPDPQTAASRRDRDAFDDVADHLLVVDHLRGEGPEGIVATYRLIRREAAERIGRFYSADEFDLTLLDAFPGRSWSWAAHAFTPATAGERRCSCCGGRSRPTCCCIASS